MGETGNLIFGVWHALKTSAPIVLPLIEDGHAIPDDERAGRAVRETFLTSFPDSLACWMQKPIGIPRAMHTYEDPGGDEAVKRYWQVMRSSFPKARYFTILRHPCDVVLSSRAHSGRDERALWRALGRMARYLTHADSPVQYAVRYDRLVRDQEGAARELFSAMAIPYHDSVLSAFDQTYVPTPGREQPALSDYSRRHEWTELDPHLLAPGDRQAIAHLFAKFGDGLEWPDHFQGVSPPVEASDESIESLRAGLTQLQGQLERIHGDYFERMQSREQEFTRLWSEQQAWIAELQRANAWLHEQRLYWQKQAEQR